jgi:hypothetical protein
VSKRLLLLLTFVLFPAVTATAAPHELGVTFAGRRVTATGITPGADVVFYAVGYAQSALTALPVKASAVVHDDDRKGSVTFENAFDIPTNCVWVVVDLTNGQFTVAHAGDALHEVPLSPNAFRKGSAGDVDVLAHSAIHMEGLYIQPGRGVLTWTATDGGSDDADRKANGVVVISLAQAKPLAGRNIDKRAFTPGGVLVAIDYHDLRVAVARIDGSMLAGAR